MQIIKQYKFKPQSNEWKNKRAEIITATEAASFFALNPYKSAAKVIKSKYEPDIVQDNVYMRAGRILESGVFVALNELGVPAKPADYENVVMYVDETNKIGCTLDGVMNVKEGRYVVECKTTSEQKFEAWSEAPPLNYLVQTLIQIQLAKSDRGILACMGLKVPELPLIVYEIDPRPELYEFLIEMVNSAFTKYKADERIVISTVFKEKALQIIDGCYTKIIESEV